MRSRIVPALAVLVTLSACSGTTASGQPNGSTPAPPAAAGPTGSSSGGPAPDPQRKPGFRVEQITGGLEHGWDIGFLPDGKILVTERPGRFALISGNQPGATMTHIKADLSDVFHSNSSEGGLLGMVIHPDFKVTHQFTTCLDHMDNGVPTDIRLVTWQLSDDETSAVRVKDLLTGLPINKSSGRHSGCRPTFAHDGALLVGTGDTASDPRISQDRNRLGGKVLRISLSTGTPAAGNPFPNSPVYTYGHRNVQGVAPRPGTDQVFTVEHGPDKNDEVNLLKAGANYGWDPSKGGANTSSYDESVPMTDLQRFPDAVPAKWQSGDTTEATCAAVFLDGPQWGAFDGALVVTALKGAKLLVLTLDGPGNVTSVTVPDEFKTKYGRLRAARIGPDGALYLTTSNGNDDKLLRVTPS